MPGVFYFKMNELNQMAKNYHSAKEQIFVVCSKEGYYQRLSPKSPLEKRQMYQSYPFVIQTGYRCLQDVHLTPFDGAPLILNPGTLRIGAVYHTRRQICTISLESRHVPQLSPKTSPKHHLGEPGPQTGSLSNSNQMEVRA